MKVYPKIPRYDHPVVPDSFFDADDLVVVEKFDGSAFRFTLYDERYADAYPETVVETADGDGSLVFGTRRSIMGCHRDPLSEIDGALHRAVRCLRESVDTDALRRVHDEYASPLVVYAENLVYSTLDYGYTDRDLPALVGFDVLPYDRIETYTPPGNPYAETFEGFLDTPTTWRLLDRIRHEDALTEHALFKNHVILKAVDDVTSLTEKIDSESSIALALSAREPQLRLFDPDVHSSAKRPQDTPGIKCNSNLEPPRVSSVTRIWNHPGCQV